MSNLLKSKFLLGVMTVAIMFVGAVAVNATTASADCSITTTLRLGSTGAQVVCLQTALGGLTADGNFGPMTKAAVVKFQTNAGLTADGVFGAMSRAAWMANAGNSANFPAGCTSAAGYSVSTGLSCAGSGLNLPAGCSSTSGFSPTTGLLCSVASNLPAGCSSTAGFSPTTGAACNGTVVANNNGPVAGGAGSISDFRKDSSYLAVQVTQGATDTKVAAFAVEADTGSDLAFQTLSLDLQRTGGTATAGSTTLSHYLSSVSIWNGSTRVATVNAADFTKSGTTYSKNIQLSNAVVRAGQSNTFYITVNANNVIDSADLGHNIWTATVQSMRYVDGTGAIMTDATTGDLPYAPTFSFESLTTAGEKELKISTTTGQDAINKAHVVVASTTSTTNDVSLLAFDIKAKGEIKNITSIPFGVKAMGGTGDVHEIASAFTLWKDGVKIDTIDVSEGSTGNYTYTDVAEVSGCSGTNAEGCSINFDNIDFNLADGSTTHFVIKANLYKIASNFAEGDSLLASINATAVDAILADDVNGTSFAAPALIGTATGEAIVFRSMGLNATLVSTTANVAVGASSAKDIGTYTITFDVTAFGSDVYVDGTKPSVDGTSGTASTVVINGANTPTEDAIIRAPGIAITSGGTIDTTATYFVPEGTTQRFVITSVVTPSASAAGLTSVQLTSLAYALTNVDSTTEYTTNLGDFVTPSVNLKATN